VSVVTSRDHGTHWSPGTGIPDLAALEQQMPRLAVGMDGRISLAWIAQAPGGHIWPSHAWSFDDGRTWSAPQRVRPLPSQRGGPNSQSFLGDYIGNAVDADGRAHPVWTDPREIRLNEPGGTIYTRTFTP
jgi:hypothetical protein